LPLLAGEFYAENFPGLPEAHARSPSAGAAADDNGHTRHFILTCELWVGDSYEIAKGPDLAAMGMAGKHQAAVGFLTATLLRLPFLYRNTL